MATSVVGMCGVCAQNPPKYKCPRCKLPYCGIPCYKTHKETPCEVSTATAAATASAAQADATSAPPPQQDLKEQHHQQRQQQQQHEHGEGHQSDASGAVSSGISDPVASALPSVEKPVALDATAALRAAFPSSDGTFGLTEAQMARLQGAEHVVQMMRNPHLRELILKVGTAKSENAEKELEAARTTAIFEEFAHECVRICSDGADGGAPTAH